MNIRQLIIKEALWQYDNSNLHVQTLKSGKHSDLYLNSDQISTSLLETVVKNIFAKEIESRGLKPDWVVTYPPFGLPIAYALVKNIGANFAYVDTKKEECNFGVKKGDSVIVVGDDIYSGGSLKKTISTMNYIGAKVESPIFVIGNLSGAETLMGLEIVSAISEKANMYHETDCPMCKAGSKAVLARPNWNELMKR